MQITLYVGIATIAALRPCSERKHEKPASFHKDAGLHLVWLFSFGFKLKRLSSPDAAERPGCRFAAQPLRPEAVAIQEQPKRPARGVVAPRADLR